MLCVCVYVCVCMWYKWMQRKRKNRKTDIHYAYILCTIWHRSRCLIAESHNFTSLLMGGLGSSRQRIKKKIRTAETKITQPFKLCSMSDLMSDLPNKNIRKKCTWKSTRSDIFHSSCQFAYSSTQRWHQRAIIKIARNAFGKEIGEMVNCGDDLE